MLRSVDGLKGNGIIATDGTAGSVHDLLFDDGCWTIRYLVVDTRLVGGRRVLVSPMAVEETDGVAREIRVSVTADEIERGPSIESDAPVHRQVERSYLNSFHWPYYWGMGGVWGAYATPRALVRAARAGALARGDETEQEGDPHLRSVREVAGYHIRATDGELGHVEDFLVDEESWTIRYIVVDTRNWWFGRKVLVSPEWTSRISWDDREVAIAHTREEIRRAPEWDPTDPINREYEARLYDAYGRPKYWEEEEARDVPTGRGISPFP